ncbi:transcriptional regulator NrdR [Lentisphaera marina]|uniref:transcriptional regulator NrdR n=1 Tax=Lentisphaera marina TaxID=1111041 RepID=UPI00236621D8|nr:transcriptional regulator NrdR [Lentisphaera marina]MDD7984551.1 transcriptional regulator NrdR [Lentisphaera marina]
MRCPECSSTSNKVLETRLSKDRNLLRRRRQCNSCETRFSTQEELVRGDLMVTKSSGRKEDFNIQKVREGLQLALRKRPVSDGAINEAVENIKSIVSDRLDREVFSHEIGEMVMMELKRLDEVAYVRFASVYREFKDASEFIETIQSMQDPEYDSDQQ